jgi:hypothetical protein
MSGQRDLIPAVEPAAAQPLVEVEASPVDLRHGVMGLPVERMAVVLNEYAKRRDFFREWLLKQLKPGIHYGYPPGCEPKRDKDGNYLLWMKNGYVIVPPEQWQPKECLYKAGAELITDLMMARDEYVADEEGWRQLGSPPGTYVYKCRLYSKATGELLGEGLGARRNGQKGGDENNAIKMAQKAAKVAAVLNTWGLSDLFTQDLDDQPPPHENPQQRPDAPVAATRSDRVTKEEVTKELARWKSLRGDTEATKDRFAAWVENVCGRKFDTGKFSEWTLSDLAAVRDANALEAKEASGN